MGKSKLMNETTVKLNLDAEQIFYKGARDCVWLCATSLQALFDLSTDFQGSIWITISERTFPGSYTARLNRFGNIVFDGVTRFTVDPTTQWLRLKLKGDGTFYFKIQYE